MKTTFLKRRKNTEAITYKLLKLLEVRFNSASLRSKIRSHPDYPSLLSIVDLFAEWNIKSDIYQISLEELQQKEISFPFIAHTKAPQSKFLIIHGLNQKSMIYSDEENSFKKILCSEFEKMYSGVFLFPSKSENAGEPDYGRKRFQYLFKKATVPILLITVFLACLLGSWLAPASPYLISGYFIKFLGISISIMLLAHTLDSNNSFTKKICKLNKGKNGCNEILKSKAANITSWLTWSEVGFYYFSGTFLFLLFSNGISEKVPHSLLTLLSVAAIPYTFYSISFQYKKRSWCILCLSIQVILILDLSNNIWTNPAQISFSTFPSGRVILTLALSFLIPVMGWSLVKPLLKVESRFKSLSDQLKEFKFNAPLFKNALLNQNKFEIGSDLMPIIIGDPGAKHTITVVANPDCQPCSEAHDKLIHLIKTRSDIKANIILTTTDEPNNVPMKVAVHVSSLMLSGNNGVALEALHKWYQSKHRDFDKWSEQHPSIVDSKAIEVLKIQRDWCDLVDIAYTPTIFVNGYMMPEPYEIEDMQYLLV